MTAPTIARRYVPRGAALEVFKCKDPEVLLSGPAGTGKSRACLEKVHALALKNKGFRGLIVRKTLSSLGSTGLETWRKFVVPESMEAGHVTFYGGSSQEPPQYRYANGARVYIGGLDKASKIMSSEYDVIFVQEATELTEDDWDMLTTRLRNGAISFQQIIADCNPQAPNHWLKLRCDAGKCKMLHCRHEDNPVLFNGDGTLTERGQVYIDRLDNLSGVRLARLRHGRWVTAEGAIYGEYWDPAIHLRRSNMPNLAWDRIWVIDFGYTNPFVCQFWAVDPDGRGHMYREIYRTKRLVEDHAKDILACLKPDEPKPRSIVCDHDAEDRATLERHLGRSTVPARKGVSDGIQAVQTRLRVQADGKPRLYFNPSSLLYRDQDLADAGKPTKTVDEFASYVWRDHMTKEEPVKENDHGMDCVRYFCAELDLGVRPRVRWLG